jgi:O-antigen ligase
MARLNIRQVAPAGAVHRPFGAFGLRPSLQLPNGFWQVGVTGVAIVLGAAAGVQPKLAIAAMLGLVFVAVVLSSLATGLAILVALAFFEEYSEVGAISLTKLVGLLLALALLAAIAAGRREEREALDLVARQPALVAVVCLFTAWATISLVWAESSHAGAAQLGRLALNFSLFPIAFAALRTRRHAIWLFSVFVASALLSVGFGLTHPPDPSAPTVGRLGGAGLNPNQLGNLLAVSVVLTAGLAASVRSHPLARVAALGAGAGCAAGLFLTVSRGALLGLGVSLLVAPFAVGRGRRAAAIVLSGLVLAGAVGWFAAVASSGDVERITHPEEAGGSGREDLWRMGRRMTEAHPITGVGVGNFPVASIHYLIQPGAVLRDEYILDRPLVAHNIYLHVLSELGIVGLTLFALILILSLRSMLDAARAFSIQGDRTSEILARTLFIAVVGFLAAEFFSSQLLSKQLWFLLATGPALQALAYRQARHRR